jgi:hypothetical protein
MTNSIKTTKYSAMFLAIILVAGTITAFFPSFMVGTAQAVSYPDMDRDRDSDRKQVSVSSLKCNNINVNVNGLELDVFPPFLGGEVAATAAEGETNANSFANNNGGSNSGSQINDFRFICINNNNNTVIEEETPLTPVEECAETDEIEACFADAEFMGGMVGFPEFVAALEAGITVEINGQEITLRSFNDICLAFEGLTTYEQLTDAVGEIEDATGADFGEGFFAVVNCLAEAIGIPIPTDNGVG